MSKAHNFSNQVVALTAFDVVVSPKRTKSFKWIANVEDATLESLKEHMREEYDPASLEMIEQQPRLLQNASAIRIKGMTPQRIGVPASIKN